MRFDNISAMRYPKTYYPIILNSRKGLDLRRQVKVLTHLIYTKPSKKASIAPLT